MTPNRTAQMAETTEAPLWNENEPAKVESWRLHILLQAGYPVHLAERIAGSEVDLHNAVELVRTRLRADDGRRDPPVAARHASPGRARPAPTSAALP